MRSRGDHMALATTPACLPQSCRMMPRDAVANEERDPQTINMKAGQEDATDDTRAYPLRKETNCHEILPRNPSFRLLPESWSLVPRGHHGIKTSPHGSLAVTVIRGETFHNTPGESVQTRCNQLPSSLYSNRNSVSDTYDLSDR